MDTTEEYIRISTLIAREMTGTIGKKDLEELEHWLQEGKGNRKIYDNIRKRLNGLYGEPPCSGKEAVPADWDGLLSRLDEKNGPRVSQKNLFIRKLTGYVAILFLLLATGGLYIARRGGQTGLGSLSRGQAGETLVIPARKQPTLVLNDGSVMPVTRENVRKELTPYATSDGNGLVYMSKDSVRDNGTEFNTMIIPEGGEYQIKLEDGTVIWLNEKTELKYPVSFSGNTREIYLNNGEVFLDVARDGRRPFILHTGLGSTRVLGTRFDTKYIPGEKMVTTLVAGSVKVETGNKDVKLLPSQQAIIGKTAEEILIMDVEDMEEVTCWKDNLFLFKDETLETIMDVLGGWYGFTVFYETPKLRNGRFFIRVSKYSTIEEMLEVITGISDIKFRVNGKVVSVYK